MLLLSKLLLFGPAGLTKLSMEKWNQHLSYKPIWAVSKTALSSQQQNSGGQWKSSSNTARPLSVCAGFSGHFGSAIAGEAKHIRSPSEWAMGLREALELLCIIKSLRFSRAEPLSRNTPKMPEDKCEPYRWCSSLDFNHMKELLLRKQTHQ